MIFDTGSNWLWVDSISCVNCPSDVKYFNQTESTTFSYDNTTQILSYGSGSVQTYQAIDQICITNEYCSPDFSFMIVIKQNNLDMIQTSGLVGMSPNHYDE